ncbi:hypothetical protein FDP41_011464 [Naegleria fowleri]|uniref:WW domain-containing protein n=1 Tax=Naegleria fowleri TaxID=5763 RepID=A0A6A5C7R8_NAEFO|nr:uncharacterized protein FDP41_011464 [Naegleria fowleri]KAF0982534.1 hypothetical protein FDP41_011464 [Naegleria fowleri]CAG4715284.1 unnamed protein product [Naegleria fowleri]
MDEDLAEGDDVLIEQEEPTEEDVLKYAEFLGIDPQLEPELLDIAREGIKAPLPEGWRPCQSDGQLYYFNFHTGESIWDHPLDAYYKQKVKEERMKRATKKPKLKTKKKQLGKLEPIMRQSDGDLLSKKKLNDESSSVSSASSRNTSPIELQKLQEKISSLEQQLESSTKEKLELQRKINTLHVVNEQIEAELLEQKSRLDKEFSKKLEKALAEKEEELTNKHKQQVQDMFIENRKQIALARQEADELYEENMKLKTNQSLQKERISKETQTDFDNFIRNSTDTFAVQTDICLQTQRTEPAAMKLNPTRTSSAQTDSPKLIPMESQTLKVELASTGCNTWKSMTLKDSASQTTEAVPIQKDVQQLKPRSVSQCCQTTLLQTRETTSQTDGQIPSTEMGIQCEPKDRSPINKSNTVKTPLKPILVKSKNGDTPKIDSPVLSPILMKENTSPQISKKHSSEYYLYKEKVEKKISDEKAKLRKVKEFCEQEKETIRSRQAALEQARQEWKSDVANSSSVDDGSQQYTSRILKSVKQHLEKQAHSLNNDVKRVNEIQNLIKLRKQKIKLLEESISDPNHFEVSKCDTLDSPLSISSPSTSSSSSSLDFGKKNLVAVLNRIEDELAQIHKKIETQNKQSLEIEKIKPLIEIDDNVTLNEASYQSSIFQKWTSYFKQTEKRRRILQQKINAFQHQLDKWIAERDHKRDLFLRHGHWLLSLKEELR